MGFGKRHMSKRAGKPAPLIGAALLVVIGLVLLGYYLPGYLTGERAVTQPASLRMVNLQDFIPADRLAYAGKQCLPAAYL